MTKIELGVRGARILMDQEGLPESGRVVMCWKCILGQPQVSSLRMETMHLCTHVMMEHFGQLLDNSQKAN